MADVQVQEIFRTINNIVIALSKAAKPSFNKYELLYSIISGVIAVGGFWFIQYIIDLRRQNKHYRNLLLLITFDLFLNFRLLTEIGPGHPEKPLILKLETWDKVNIEIAKRLKNELMLELQGLYFLLAVLNGRTYNSFAKKLEDEKDGENDIETLMSYITKLIEISKMDNRNKDSMLEKFKKYRQSKQIACKPNQRIS